MPEKTKIAIIYYSSTGTVYKLAKSIAGGVERAGAEVRLRKVHELAPDDAISANVGWASHVAETQDVVEATPAPLTSRQGDIPISDSTRQAAAFQGARVARIATALKIGLS